MKHFKLLITICFLTGLQNVQAQNCFNCIANISAASSESYTLNTGQTLCIDSTGRYTGTITLNGGTVCNNGIFKPALLNFLSGEITNYRIFNYSDDITLSAGKLVNNKPKSIIRLDGSLVVNGGQFTNEGVSNIRMDVSNLSGTFDNKCVINCRNLSGSNTYVKKGIINSR